MLKQFYNYLSKNTVTLLAVSHAMTDRDEKKAVKLILKGQDAIANLSVGPYPLLGMSLTKGLNYCTAALLKFGADPNKECQDPSWPSKMIQTEINYKNSSNIRILLLNGANLDGVSLEEGSESLKEFIEKKAEQYKKMAELQKAIQAHPPQGHLKILLETLATLWQEEANEEEPVIAYKSFQELERAETACEPMTELGPQKYEHKPLLAKIKTH